jgi:hypothetical protein
MWKVLQAHSRILFVGGFVTAVFLLCLQRLNAYYIEPDVQYKRAFRVHDNGMLTLGWVNVKYHRYMRTNEDAPLEVEYISDARNWNGWANEARPNIKIVVSSAHIQLSPETHEYIFKRDVITNNGRDNYIWLMLPILEGDYTVLLTVSLLDGIGLNVTPISVNGVESQSGSMLPLPVTVYTRYFMSQAAINVVYNIGYVLSFLLTLPFIGGIAKSYLQRQRLPSRKRREKI